MLITKTRERLSPFSCFYLLDASFLRPYDLVKLLCGKTRLGNHVTAILREAVIKHLLVANADYIAKLVPIIIGI